MKRLLKGNTLRMLLLNILVLLSYSGFSAKYYVDVAGSNSNNGSSSSPWLTLAHACTNVTTPGDIIHLNAGTFNETARANLAVGVSIEGEGIDATIINSRYVATSSSDGVIRLNSSGYTSGNQSISNLTLTGSNLTATRGICINYRSNVTINNCKVMNFYASAIFFRGSNQAWDVEPNPYCSGNKIYNCVVNNSATRSSGESASIRINGQNGFLLYNNTFNQTFRASGQNGNILGGEWNKGLKIYDNTFTKPDNEGSAWNFFFELWHWQGGGEIYRNTFNGAATMDIVDVMKSTDEYGLKIYDNKYLVNAIVPFTAHQIQSINLEGRSHLDDIHVYNNYMKNVPNAIWVDVTVNTGEGYSSFAVNNLFIHHNVIENVGMTDVNTVPIWMNAYGSNTNISFNNIQVNNNSIQCSNIVKGLNAIKWSVIGKFSNIYIQNNILVNCKDDVMNFSSQVSGATLSNVYINNNLYYNNGVNAPKFSMAVSNRVEKSNIVANPLFVSASNLNLQPTSPAINAGLNIGYPFNGDAPDMGAYESGTTTTAPTADITQPVISAFTIPTTETSLTTSITTLTATDNVGVNGYLLTQTSTPPTASTTGWVDTKPTSYTFQSAGTQTLYAWVKDAAGNVSASASQSITITLPDITQPVISAFTIPTTGTSLTTSITTLTATDNVGVNGYLLTHTSTPPTASTTGWVDTKPTSCTFQSAGTQTLYAWVKDAAGNISAGVSQTTTITLPVTTLPTNAIYLSPTGNDTNGQGTLESPWFSLNKAWSVVKAGDVIYMKGGTYLYTTGQSLRGKSGAAGSLIKVWAMPGEQPVISPAAAYTGTRGIDIYGNYIHFKGLEIKGFTQKSSTALYYGIVAENCNFLIFEQLSVHDNGFGLSIGSDSGDNLVLNSDFYRNADPLSNFGGNVPWGGADGITIRSSNLSKTNTIRGCRMWWNSDDGVDLYNNQGTIVIENSWSFWNGYQPGTFTTAGNGNGFKIGVTLTDLSTQVKRILRNNLAFENRMIGYDQNNARCITHLFNNTSYNNGYSGTAARSFNFWNGTAATVAQNNLDYKYSMSALFNSQAVVSNNTFLKNGAVNTAYSVSSSDFISLDHTGVDGPRQSNGSLPNLNFLKLAAGSDLINRGSNVGLPYNGSAPDLGAFESNYSSDVTIPVITAFTIPSTSGSLTVPISTLTATDNIGVTGYYISSSATAPTSGASGWSATKPTSYTFTNSGTRTLYAWVKDAAGNVSVSRNAVVKVNSSNLSSDPNVLSEEQLTTGIEDISQSIKIDVYPNPCVENITVRFSEIPEAGSRIEIMDNTGRIIVSREIRNSQELFDLKQQPTGLYIVKSIVGSNEIVRKLIKNK